MVGRATACSTGSSRYASHSTSPASRRRQPAPLHARQSAYPRRTFTRPCRRQVSHGTYLDAAGPESERSAPWGVGTQSFSVSSSSLVRATRSDRSTMRHLDPSPHLRPSTVAPPSAGTFGVQMHGANAHPQIAGACKCTTLAGPRLTHHAVLAFSW